MRAYIYVGGDVNTANITERPEQGDLVIAADSGWDNALALGQHPTVLLGDFDSIRAKDIPADVEIYRAPTDKDQTDTRLAVDLALTKGASEIVIIGGLSGRLDHTLGNLGILEFLGERRVHAHITDGNNRVRFLRNASTLLPRGGFRYLSLLPADAAIRGVDVDGCKYRLKNAKLRRNNAAYSVSNELVGNCAFIAVRKGAMFIIESKDAKETDNV